MELRAVVHDARKQNTVQHIEVNLDHFARATTPSRDEVLYPVPGPATTTASFALVFERT